jgi:hypothetical protein
MSSDKPQESKFVVKDRRRFDSAGEERSLGEEGAKSSSDDIPRNDAAASVQVKPATHKSAGLGAASSHGVSNGNASVSPPAARPAPPKPTAVPSAVEDEWSSQSELSFSSFVISLATQTLMQLGEIQPPPGMSVPLDRDSARNTIDILAMLHEKTAGNLSAEEARLMEEILHNLRLSYVRASKS